MIFFGIGEFLQVICTKIYGPNRVICKFKKKNVDIIWSEKQQKAFDRLKVIRVKKPVVKIFDLENDITLTTDASEHLMSGILSQEGHPGIYSSRRLTNTEFNYSVIEKEALVIVWTTTRAQQLLIRKKFLLEVIIDH